MGKRLLILGAGIALGFALTLTAARLSLAWSLFPNRELNRSLDHVRDVFRMVNENYVEASTVSYQDLAKRAVRGMVESLDPHSEFLEPGDFDELEEQLTGDFSGIGIQVELRNGRIVVIAPIANSPSERAGIQRGDEILGVDGKGLDQDEPMEGVIDLLRGKPGTRVTIDLYRPATGQRLQHTLTRERIQLESVRPPQVLADRTGYILITEFSERTGEEFGRALDTLLEQGIDSLVLDLRNNPGGLLEAAVTVAEPFFRRGELIVYTRGRQPIDSESYRAELDGEPLQLPVAVLVNAGTASAAEVVTGALKDTHRAVVVGERSFGKGSVQSIFRLGGGEGLRLTTARYYTPNGISIHEKGIVPHVEVVLSPEEDSKLRVQRTRPDVTDPAEFKTRFGFTPIADPQLETALEVLRGIRRFDERRDALAASSVVTEQ